MRVCVCQWSVNLGTSDGSTFNLYSEWDQRAVCVGESDIFHRHSPSTTRVTSCWTVAQCVGGAWLFVCVQPIAGAVWASGEDSTSEPLFSKSEWVINDCVHSSSFVLRVMCLSQCIGWFCLRVSAGKSAIHNTHGVGPLWMPLQRQYRAVYFGMSQSIVHSVLWVCAGALKSTVCVCSSH